MTQLAANVNADAERWTLDSLPSTQYVQVDDETIEVRAMFPSTTYSLTGETLPPRIRVRRGIAGTTKASHLSGATLTPNYGLGSGAGAGAIAVTGTDAAGDPIEIAAATEIVISGAPISDEGAGIVGVAVQTRLFGPYTVNFDDADIETSTGVSFGEVLPLGAVLFRAWAVTYTLWDAGTSSFLRVGLGTGVEFETVLLNGLDLQSDEYTEADKVVANIPEDTGSVLTVIAQNTAGATLRVAVTRSGDAPTQGFCKFWALIAIPA